MPAEHAEPLFCGAVLRSIVAMMVGPATGVSLDVLAETLQSAFADYPVPVEVAAGTLAATVERDDVLLDRSLVAYHDGALVGVALVAVRPGRGGMRARLAGMGVVPSARRMGVGRALVRGIIVEARTLGARTLALEVFDHNVAARRLYDAHGFVTRRRLLGFSLSAGLPRVTGGDVTLQAIGAPLALPLFALCTAGEPPDNAPPWQLEGPSLARLGPAATVYAVQLPGESRSAGYMALVAGRPTARLLHLGILPGWRRRGLATAALSAAFVAHEGVRRLSVAPLVPEGSSLVPFLTACGARREAEEQREMVLAL